MNENLNNGPEKLPVADFEKNLIDFILKTKEFMHLIYNGKFDVGEVQKIILGELKTELRVILNQYPELWQNQGEGVTAETYLTAIYEPLEDEFTKESVDGAMKLVKDLDREFSIEPDDFLASENMRERALKLSAGALLADVWYSVFHTLSNRMWPPPPVTHKRDSRDDYNSYYGEKSVGSVEESLFTPEQKDQMTDFFASLSSPIDPMFLADGYREAYLEVIDSNKNWSPSGFKINWQIEKGKSFDQAFEELVNISKSTVKIKKFLKNDYPTDAEVENLIALYKGYWQKNPHTKVGLFYKRRMDFYKKVEESRKLFSSRFSS